MYLFIKFYVCICLVLVFQTLSWGQIRAETAPSNLTLNIEEESDIPSIGPTSCESLRANLEMHIVEGKKIEVGSKIIIIFRLNKKEHTKYYDLRRKEIANWFERYYPKRVIFAKGDLTEDLGRAEIYVNGKKSFIIKFKMNDPKVCFGGNAG